MRYVVDDNERATVFETEQAACAVFNPSQSASLYRTDEVTLERWRSMTLTSSAGWDEVTYRTAGDVPVRVLEAAK